jgi:hypothetical protein
VQPHAIPQPPRVAAASRRLCSASPPFPFFHVLAPAPFPPPPTGDGSFGDSCSAVGVKRGDQPPDGAYLLNSGDLIVPVVLSADLLIVAASSAMTLASQVLAPPFPLLPCAWFLLGLFCFLLVSSLFQGFTNCTTTKPAPACGGCMFPCSCHPSTSNQARDGCYQMHTYLFVKL